MKKNTNNKNKVNNCKDKVESPNTRNYKQTQEKEQKSSHHKSSMENSDY